MQEVWSEWSDTAQVRLLETRDIELLFDTDKYDKNMKCFVKTNDKDVAERFMQKYGVKIGSQYFIEKDKFLEIIRKTGDLLADDKEKMDF